MRYPFIASLIFLLAVSPCDVGMCAAEAPTSDSGEEVYPISLKYRQQLLSHLELQQLPRIVSFQTPAEFRHPLRFVPGVPHSRAAQIDSGFGVMSLLC